jgi:glycosyltransferase involved in cell wall biosynthesis
MTRLNVGGPARQELGLTEAMREVGFDCELIAGRPDPREGTSPGAESAARVIGCLQREFHPGRDLRALAALTAHLRSRRPDVVHTHQAKAGALGRTAAAVCRVPVIVHTFHGHVLRGYFSPSATAAFVRAERAMARHTDALVAVSAAVRDDLLALGVGHPHQWHVIPLGLDLDPIRTLQDSPQRCRAILGIPLEGPLVAMASRLVAVKDPGMFLEAARLMVREMPEVTFVVAGDGDLRAQVEQEASVLFGPRMRFLGWRDDVATVYRAADVVVLSSRHEGTPATLIEAAAAGRPVVATNVGGVSDVVIDEVTGLLVQAGDPAALASGTLDLLRDPQRARAMGLAGRRHAERFSSRRLAGDLAALYTDLLAAKSERRRRETVPPRPRVVPVPWR